LQQNLEVSAPKFVRPRREPGPSDVGIYGAAEVPFIHARGGAKRPDCAEEGEMGVLQSVGEPGRVKYR
jgi:hypothetical protein